MVFLFGQFWPIDIFIVKSCVVSLESLSNVKYIIKKIFLSSAFPTELSRFKLLRTFDRFLFFVHIFRLFRKFLCPQLLKIVLNLVTTVSLVLLLK